jgi:predicted nucleic acid-binding protein
MTPVVLDTDVVSFLFESDSRDEYICTSAGMRNERSGFLRRSVVVPSSRDLVLKWAEVMVTARRNGRSLETADAWIAATAMLYAAPLVTHNVSDYLGVPGLELVSESRT